MSSINILFLFSLLLFQYVMFSVQIGCDNDEHDGSPCGEGSICKQTAKYTYKCVKNGKCTPAGRNNKCFNNAGCCYGAFCDKTTCRACVAKGVACSSLPCCGGKCDNDSCP
ncbi:unnamed protein product [Meloidogyne enterolobii]|uniref:Uncharacterized protein n=1 Tax=Meloidogyne enterolobii TaxID=390850 RepID=A0ACB0Z4N3_MELEN